MIFTRLLYMKNTKNYSQQNAALGQTVRHFASLGLCASFKQDAIKLAIKTRHNKHPPIGTQLLVLLPLCSPGSQLPIKFEHQACKSSTRAKAAMMKQLLQFQFCCMYPTGHKTNLLGKLMTSGQLFLCADWWS